MKRVLLCIVILVLAAASLSAEGKQEESAATVKDMEGEVELWHYWMAGGEVEALNALRDAFQEDYPGVKLVDRGIPGGSAEMRRQIGTALMGGNPPETFMVALGYRLKSFADADRLIPITDVWDEINGDKIFPQGLVNVIRIDGEAWSVPINIHTVNHMWYNKKMFDKYGLKEPKTWEEFGELCDVLKDNGITPLTGSGQSWALYQFYPFVLDAVGPEGYVQLGEGQLSWTDPRLRGAFEKYKKYSLGNIIEGWAGYGWAEAASAFVNGKVAMYNTVGDWTAAFYESQGMEPGVDFDFFPAPGTTDIVIGQVDSFALLNGCDRPDLGKLFLKFVASEKAQVAFNTYKGSVAANLNTPSDFYNSVMLKTYKRMKDPNTTFLPNFYFLCPPEFQETYDEEYDRYAIDPTPAVLDSVIQNLENLRKEIESEGKWVDWEWK